MTDQKKPKSAAVRPGAIFETDDGKPGLYVFVGKSKRGKSVAMKYVILDMIKNRGFKTGIVFTATKYKNELKEILPDKAIFEGWQEEVCKTYIENLKKMFEKKGNLEPSFMVFEDLAGILNIKDPYWINFFCLHRHLNISILITAQYLMQAVNPTLREQTTHCFMFNSKAEGTKENLWKAYGQLMDKKEFFEYLQNNTNAKDNGPYVFLLYREFIDETADNYTPMRVPDPKTFPKLQLKF